MTEKELIRIKAFESLSFFTRYFFKELNGKDFVLNHHHKVIFEALERVITGHTKRLIINIAPRYGKTEIAVKAMIAHCLALNPKAKFIHLSYSDQLALDNSEEIRDVITSAEYQELFPYVKIKKDSKAKHKWYTTEGGGVLARSSAGQVTGFGAGIVDDADLTEFEETINERKDFGGAIIIDDPIKPDEADSPLIREKVNTKFDTTIRNRVNSRNTPIIVIMQRLHEEDLCGYLESIEAGVWETISLPCIQADGTALWNWKHTLKELYQLKKVNAIMFGKQYMQVPLIAEGLLFAEGSLNWYKGDDLRLEDVDTRSAFIDTADQGTDSLSCPIGLMVGQKIYIHDVVYTTSGTDITPPLVGALLNKWNPEYVRIESNFGGSMFAGLIGRYVNESILLLPVTAKGNKHSRILSISGFVKEYCYFRSDYEPGSDYARFIDNLTRYLISGKSQHDDAPDSVHGLANLIKTFYADSYAAQWLTEGAVA